MHVALAGPASPRVLGDLFPGHRTSELPLGLGGTPVNELARALVAAGHQVTLVSLSPDVTAPWRVAGEGINLICQPWRARARDRARDGFRLERRGVLEGLLASRADVVHAHWTYEYACAAVASAQPTVVTIHDAPVTILRHHRDAYRLVRLGMAARVRFSRVTLTAVSPYAAQRWRREMCDPRTVHVVPNIAPSIPEPNRGSGPHHRPVVMIGTAAPLKNIDAGIDAFLLLKSGFPEMRLKVIGPGLGPDDRLALGRGGRAEGVDFLGVLSPREVHEQVGQAALLLHPSLEETQGMALLEALRLGVPVIAGERSGGVPWTLDGGRAGMLVDVTSPTAMRRGMLDLLSQPDLAASMVLRGRELLAERFSAEAVVDALLTIYRAKIGSPVV